MDPAPLLGRYEVLRLHFTAIGIDEPDVLVVSFHPLTFRREAFCSGSLSAYYSTSSSSCSTSSCGFVSNLSLGVLIEHRQEPRITISGNLSRPCHTRQAQCGQPNGFGHVYGEPAWCGLSCSCLDLFIQTDSIRAFISRPPFEARPQAGFFACYAFLTQRRNQPCLPTTSSLR
ncbi:hypothetical protein PS862_01198 [Pseudomonas fluorescens]|uniref:Uncharacterized protein n=1 Tax=Pseudomonas fluorescens TaxID=294 RepID=A0A5E7I166_PSEFL|nr:hypothetical protein PS639_00040 [Pseudomonas fluorescens]VVO68357.1 hypothetical protein PS862_01198 [Pseudomonas fluorescens]